MTSVPAPNVRALLDAFAGKRVLVVGDLVLDEYLVGRASRLSREAPVPVLELVERFWRPGAASNPAVNVATLGGRPTLLGVVGGDERGRQLLEELDREGVNTGGVLVCADRTTATKTRIMARHAAAHPQQVARIDDLPPDPLPEAVERDLIARIERLLPTNNVVLVSNYRAGVVTPAVTEKIVALAERHAVATCVDTQGDLLAFRGFRLAKSNQPDAEATLGARLLTDDDFQRAGQRLLDDLGARDIVITRGADGLSLIGAGGVHVRLAPTNPTDVWDVTGAGDTVIAVLALGLAARASLIETAQLANAAAGLVVRRIGVAAVTPAELAAAFR